MTRAIAEASTNGTGEIAVDAARGCHTLRVLSAAHDADVDGDVRDASAPRQRAAAHAIDHAERPDARLDVCTPARTDLRVQFSGAGPSASVTLLDAIFPWPTPGSTIGWGKRVTSAFALLARRRSTPTPEKTPLVEALGVEGRSLTSSCRSEPGHCYVAMAATSAGAARGAPPLRIGASRRPSFEESGMTEGASVVFCSGDEDTARVEIDAAAGVRGFVLSVHGIGGTQP